VRDADRPDRAEHSLTAVRRDWRGRGLGTALKRATIAWAAANGIRELSTWTQRGNVRMQRLNERLGYVVRSRCVSVRGPVLLRP
jgi:mycothiol synthase